MIVLDENDKKGNKSLSFTELRSGIEDFYISKELHPRKINEGTISYHLKSLEKEGLIGNRRYLFRCSRPYSSFYFLTEKGKKCVELIKVKAG
jgi:DNA-binding HxlR family transcriptional regulator